MTPRMAQDIIRRIAQRGVVSVGTAMRADHNHIRVQGLGRLHDLKECYPGPHRCLHHPTRAEHPFTQRIQLHFCRRQSFGFRRTNLGLDHMHQRQRGLETRSQLRRIVQRGQAGGGKIHRRHDPL